MTFEVIGLHLHSNPDASSIHVLRLDLRTIQQPMGFRMVFSTWNKSSHLFGRVDLLR